MVSTVKIYLKLSYFRPCRCKEVTQYLALLFTSQHEDNENMIFLCFLFNFYAIAMRTSELPDL
jgi:hypothetical protein